VHYLTNDAGAGIYSAPIGGSDLPYRIRTRDQHFDAALHTIGVAAGKRDVKSSHFPETFNLK